MAAEQNVLLNNYVHMYVSELTSKIVAKTGIHSDMFHLGKIILKSMQDDPDFILQIDGSTGESETNGEVLKKSIQCAIAFKEMGLKKGDLVALMAKNHLELCIPLYAALFLGIMVMPIDRLLGVGEIKDVLNTNRPNVVFCQADKVEDTKHASESLGLKTTIVSFDHSPDALHFATLLNNSGDDIIDIQNFEATNLDPEESIALLVPTSGTTGIPKTACLTYKNLAIAFPYMWNPFTKFPSPFASAFVVAPLQWMSAIFSFICGPYIKFTRIQSPMAMTPQHTCAIIRDFKPEFLAISPTMLTTVMNVVTQTNCDISCFKYLLIGGSAVHHSLLEDIKKLNPRVLIAEVYGMTEIGGLALNSLESPRGSSGRRLGHLQYKLMDIETGEEIQVPNKSGELWLKAPGAGFKGYYNRPDETEAVLCNDGWFKTGDLLYRDEHWNYYFVERVKLLLKYRNHQISPVELESVIKQHPGVLDAAVTGLPDLEYGELPIACVVKRTGAKVTEEDIQNIVKENLTDSKQLRGGVIFMEKLPLTSSTKIHRRKLKEIAIQHADGKRKQ